MTWLLPAFWACLVAAMRIARGGVSHGWRLWTPLAVLTLIVTISLMPFNHIAISVTIIALWLLAGALYLRSAGIPSPLAILRGQPAATEGARLARPD